MVEDQVQQLELYELYGNLNFHLHYYQYNKLPKTGRIQYNSKNMNDLRDELDSIISYILYHDSTKYIYASYLKLLEEHQKELNQLYGQSNTINNRKYYNEQLNRLYTKIGNEILANYKIYQSMDIMEREKDFLKKNTKQ